MAFATDLQVLGAHFVTWLTTDMTSIDDVDGDDAFAAVVYGEPRVVQVWPTLSVQPQRKLRDIKGTRKYELTFHIDLVLYHGQVADTLAIQAKAHKRMEAVEGWVLADLQWNFDDTGDVSKDKVIFGFPVELDHPVVLAPEQELWSASRLRLQGKSEEVF